MAPEVLNGSGYSKPADIFSLGVILVIKYFLLIFYEKV
jgi:serine/threonine protein kinase